MRTLAEAFFWIVLCLFCWQWEKYLSISGFSPDFILITVLAAASFSSKTRGSSWAFLLGLYSDVRGSGPLGANALIFTACAWLVQSVSQRFDFFDKFTQAVAVFLFSWVAYLMGWVLTALFAHGSVFSIKYLCLIPFFNAIAAPFVFFLVLGLKSFFRFYEKN
ncbi:MAG: rod shape-determining protein MreD [Elusimicrobiales bacterium]|nr:rod shape-determining protein MreD [Elusimicrobiales bacterium]